MNFLSILFQNLGDSFYRLTSFAIGDSSMAQVAGSAQDYVLNSNIGHILQFVALVVTIIFGIAIIWLVGKSKELNQKIVLMTQQGPSEPAMAGPLSTRWQEIMSHVDSIREGEWKFAIIEADKLVDDILKDRFAGDTMGERLMGIDKTSLLSIDGLWEAHKVRNRLAHEPNYFLRHAEAVRAIRFFETTLKELGVI